MHYEITPVQYAVMLKRLQKWSCLDEKDYFFLYWLKTQSVGTRKYPQYIFKAEVRKKTTPVNPSFYAPNFGIV